MTHVHLCAGPGLLVIQKDGLLFYRRPGQPDALFLMHLGITPSSCARRRKNTV